MVLSVGNYNDLNPILVTENNIGGLGELTVWIQI